MTERIPVTKTHADHYLKLEAWHGGTVVWWDGFTGLTIVVTELTPGLSMAVGANLLVSVIDRHSQQTFAWAFHSDASVDYIAEKVPRKAFNKPWRTRLAQSIQLTLRLHAHVTTPREVATS